MKSVVLGWWYLHELSHSKFEANLDGQEKDIAKNVISVNYPTMHLSHTPRYKIQNRNVHISGLNRTVRVMGYSCVSCSHMFGIRSYGIII